MRHITEHQVSMWKREEAWKTADGLYLSQFSPRKPSFASGIVAGENSS